MGARTLVSSRREPQTQGAAGWWGFVPLSDPARIAVVAAAVVILLADLVLMFAGGSPSAGDLTGLLLWIALAGFAWRPPWAAAATVALIAVDAALGVGAAGVLAVALMTGLVVATCGGAFVVLYAVAVLAGIVFAGWIGQTVAPGGEAGLLAAAIVSGLCGEVARRMRVRQERGAAAAERSRRAAARAVRAERDRIADELHDVLAHDVTIMVMHARALPLARDDEARRLSEGAILAAGTQALADIRRVLQIVHDESGDHDAAASPQRSLPETLESLRRELEALGASVEISSAPAEAVVSTIVETTLARVAREAVTNVIKHGPAQPSVRLSLSVGEEEVSLRVRNSSPRTRASAATGGYGLVRMRERVTLLGGTLTAGHEDGGWVVEVVLPRR